MRMRGAQALDIVETNLSSAANLSSCGVPDRSYRGLTRLQALNRPARAPGAARCATNPFVCPRSSHSSRRGDLSRLQPNLSLTSDSQDVARKRLDRASTASTESPPAVENARPSSRWATWRSTRRATSRRTSTPRCSVCGFWPTTSTTRFENERPSRCSRSRTPRVSRTAATRARCPTNAATRTRRSRRRSGGPRATYPSSSRPPWRSTSRTAWGCWRACCRRTRPSRSSRWPANLSTNSSRTWAPRRCCLDCRRSSKRRSLSRRTPRRARRCSARTRRTATTTTATTTTCSWTTSRTFAEASVKSRATRLARTRRTRCFARFRDSRSRAGPRRTARWRWAASRSSAWSCRPRWRRSATSRRCSRSSPPRAGTRRRR
mmetsp:Transcript_14641/g.45353  ORF Transcript_14641/g.45353 Transcript_14641/m.45353 type:complete len:377 (-) Transcript_14641:498-1628(-)